MSTRQSIVLQRIKQNSITCIVLFIFAPSYSREWNTQHVGSRDPFKIPWETWHASYLGYADKSHNENIMDRVYW